MRQIEYIFIDSDTQAHSNKSGRHDAPNFRFHFIVNGTGLSASAGEAHKALLCKLCRLRRRYPDAKILGVSEIEGRELYCKNIIVSDAMNVLRRKLSDYP